MKCNLKGINSFFDISNMGQAGKQPARTFIAYAHRSPSGQHKPHPNAFLLSKVDPTLIQRPTGPLANTTTSTRSDWSDVKGLQLGVYNLFKVLVISNPMLPVVSILLWLWLAFTTLYMTWGLYYGGAFFLEPWPSMAYDVKCHTKNRDTRHRPLPSRSILIIFKRYKTPFADH